ncbi:MAG: S-formylglutathione hydrolase [Luminiphilus sp.]|nr:S-formylglutathione hydrolase [Luminiphilus sp.]
MGLELLSSNRCFAGEQKRYQATSETLSGNTVFSVFIPDFAAFNPLPVLIYLSGLTCTDENAVTKAGAQRVASELGIAVVFPDTSPRGDDVADDPDGAYDLGSGAGFYINATQSPWASHYQMESFIVEELPGLLDSLEGLDLTRVSICGHSMGGHGAITLALKHPGTYRSVSAFSPICNPTDCPWGHKAFTAYLGEDQAEWQQHDASILIRSGAQQVPLLVDQGAADAFLEDQLKPDALRAACDAVGFPLTYREHDGFDHSYFFIASFIEEHLRFHAKFLYA